MYTGNLDIDTTVMILSIDKMKSSPSEFGVYKSYQRYIYVVVLLLRIMFLCEETAKINH